MLLLSLETQLDKMQKVTLNKLYKFVINLEITIWLIYKLELKIKKQDNLQLGDTNPNKSQ